MKTDFSITHKPLDVPDAYLIEVKGSIDISSSMEFEEIARTLIHSGKERLIFDLGGLTYINTKGLGALLTIQKILDAEDGRVIVAGAVGRVKNSIEMTGLNRIIRLYSRLNDALESLGD